MLSVDDVLIDDGLLDARFRCDLFLCRGACCVEGELGAPVLPRERDDLLRAAQKLRQRLPEKNARYIARHGCLEHYRGDLFTRTVDGKECVFARRRGNITLCAIEEDFLPAETPAHKPLSCRLFPIRVRKKFGLDYLVYERHAMCRHAVQRGRETGTLLIDYVCGALVELYGMSWFNRLKEFQVNLP